MLYRDYIDVILLARQRMQARLVSEKKLYVFVLITEGHRTIAHVHYVNWAVSLIKHS